MLPRRVFNSAVLAAALALPALAEAAPRLHVKGAARRTREPHQKGPPPRVPAARLPDDAERPQVHPGIRRDVAGGPTSADEAAPPDDPQLAALARAELTLFPRSLPGLTPGFRFGDAGRPAVDLSGLPPGPDRTVVVAKATPIAADDARWLASLDRPDLKVRVEARVLKYLKYYRDKKRGQAIARAWARRSGRYVATIQAMLARAGLPVDLVWLSLIESGHTVKIRSHAGALGLWQFMPRTARSYGLVVDRWVDERLDPYRATEAAIDLLDDLHRRFGTWELAMAAYNMGYGGVSRAIVRYNSNDYWELCRYENGIPWETTLYVPKIMAVALMMRNKAAFHIDGEKLDDPIAFDAVLVKPGTPLASVARAAGVTIADLKTLNPAYRRDRVPPKARNGKHPRWRVRVPEGKGSVTRTKLSAHRGLGAYRPHRVRFGEVPETIAARYGMATTQLRRVNGIGRHERLQAGTLLLVTGKDGGDRFLDRTMAVLPPRRFAYPGRTRVFYEVQGGDTTVGVARAFHVPEDDLRLWNALDDRARLRSGMVLQAFVEDDAVLERVRHLPESAVDVLVAGSPDFLDRIEGEKGRRRVIIAAREGDTLRKLAKRYGMSVGSLERINRLSRYSKLEVGRRLAVYVKKGSKVRGLASAPKAPEPSPLEAAPRPEALPPAPKP